MGSAVRKISPRSPQEEKKQILENRARVRQHMIEVHGAVPDEHVRVGIMVSADGSWPIRGFSSASGQGALIYENGDAFPPTVVTQACRGKYCAKCHWYETVEPTWACPVHECPRNWTDSSKSMEADILVNLVEEVGRGRLRWTTDRKFRSRWIGGS